MEGMNNDQIIVAQQMINDFTSIATGVSSYSATQYLRSTNWNLEEALSHFFSRNQNQNQNRRDYMVVDDDGGLDSLYPRPVNLIHRGSFENSKSYAKGADKWLIINIQSKTEFNSNMLNAHTWSNQTLADSIRGNFVFWQVYDDTEEGQKVSTYYKVQSRPVIMVIDPVTGLRMRCWSGMIEAQTLMEDLMCFIEQSPKHTPSSKYKAVISEIHRKRKAFGYY